MTLKGQLPAVKVTDENRNIREIHKVYTLIPTVNVSSAQTVQH